MVDAIVFLMKVLGILVLVPLAAASNAASSNIIANITAKVGDNVTIPCHLGYQKNLMKDGFDIKKDKKECFIYYNGTTYNNGRDGQDPQFKGRVRLVPEGLQTGDASVILSNVKPEDAGLFKCYFPRLKVTKWTHLTVDPPVDPQSSQSTNNVTLYMPTVSPGDTRTLYIVISVLVSFLILSLVGHFVQYRRPCTRNGHNTKREEVANLAASNQSNGLAGRANGVAKPRVQDDIEEGDQDHVPDTSSSLLRGDQQSCVQGSISESCV